MHCTCWAGTYSRPVEHLPSGSPEDRPAGGHSGAAHVDAIPPPSRNGPAAAVHEFPRLPHSPVTHLAPQVSAAPASPTTHARKRTRAARRRRPAGQLKKPISYRPRGREESPPAPAEARVGWSEGGISKPGRATGGGGPHADRLQPPRAALRRAAAPQAAPSAAAVRDAAAGCGGRAAEEGCRGGGRVRVALRRAPRAGEARARTLQGEPATSPHLPRAHRPCGLPPLSPQIE